MKKTHPTPYFYEDKPLFGLDIGHDTVRVVQTSDDKQPKVIGYGEISFPANAIENGVIVRHEEIAQAIQKLFSHSLVGDITTKRVSISLPISRAFTRSVELPKLTYKELQAAVKTEVDQYIPAAAESLYIDFTSLPSGKDKWATYIVAMPRRIVDSHMTLCRMLGLEPVIIQTSSGAGASLYDRDDQSDLPSVLVDFGSESADITVYDQAPTVSGTVAFGGEEVTRIIEKSLGVTTREATIIKSKYGLNLSKKQKQIESALEPSLKILVKELQRSIRYYEERAQSTSKIAQIITMGGGANMPGLAEYLTHSIRLPVRAFDPTKFIDFGRLQPFNTDGRMSYVTATSLSLMRPEEAF